MFGGGGGGLTQFRHRRGVFSQDIRLCPTKGRVSNIASIFRRYIGIILKRFHHEWKEMLNVDKRGSKQTFGDCAPLYSC